jgi:fic/DOC family
VPVTIGGSSYVPPLPNKLDVKDRIREITEEDDEAINIAIKLWSVLYENTDISGW